MKFEISPAISRGLLIAAILLPLGFREVNAHGTHSSLMTRIDAQLAESPEDGGLWYRRAVLGFEHEDFANVNTVNLDVNGNSLTCTFVQSGGATPDNFTITKQGAADTSR